MAAEPNLSLDELLDVIKPSGLPNTVMYQYYKLLAQRKVLINEQINSSIIENAVLPLLEMDNDGTGKPIEIILNSVGGSVFDGMALCDVIDH